MNAIKTAGTAATTETRTTVGMPTKETPGAENMSTTAGI